MLYLCCIFRSILVTTQRRKFYGTGSHHAQQVAVLFLLIGTGMVAVKTGVLKLENKQALSNLLVYIIVPAWW